MAHNHDAANGFRSALIQRSAPQGRPQGNVADILDIDRNVIRDFDHRVFHIRNVFDKSQTANDILHPIYFDGSCSHINIGHFDGGKNFIQSHAKGTHRIGININLIFLDKPAHGSHFGHAFCAHQAVTDIPVLNAAQLIQVPASRRLVIRRSPLERVPEYLAQGGCVWAKSRINAFRQQTRRQGI